MKLYYSPGACSLADHIALLEAGLPFQIERVDLKEKRTATGADYTKINHKGYVPALALDDGNILTENVAILDWISQQNPRLAVDGKLGRTRLLEVLTFISAELHKPFHPFFVNRSDAEKDAGGKSLAMRFEQLAGEVQREYIFGDHPTVADFYLFVMLRWANKFGIDVPASLVKLRDRLLARPAVAKALKDEGLSGPESAAATNPLPLKTGT